MAVGIEYGFDRSEKWPPKQKRLYKSLSWPSTCVGQSAIEVVANGDTSSLDGISIHGKYHWPFNSIFQITVILSFDSTLAYAILELPSFEGGPSPSPGVTILHTIHLTRDGSSGGERIVLQGVTRHM